jgi:predicted CXXCH cytochrome family protein
VPYPEAEVSTWQNPHDYQGKPLCQRCHELQGGALRGHPIGLCVSCHTFGHGNHPVNVAQKPPLPKDLPFLEGGKLACHTCHDPHDLKAHQAGLRAEFNDLCLRCHVKH